MTKLKTNKSVAKRFRVTRRGKLLRRVARQDHFNAKAPGREVRAKRQSKAVKKPEEKMLAGYLPY